MLRKSSTRTKGGGGGGGVRSGRGYADKIFCPQMLIEKCVEFQLPALVIIVDFKAAFEY